MKHHIIETVTFQDTNALGIYCVSKHGNTCFVNTTVT